MTNSIESVTIYRGISVPNNQVSSVTANLLGGRLMPESRWMNYTFHKFTPEELEIISTKNRIEESDMRPVNRKEINWMFACGDVNGAAFYAFRECGDHKLITPLLIELQIDLRALKVDGRDSLYTIAPKLRNPLVRDCISDIYGQKCINHLDRSREEDFLQIIARAEIACHDLEVVKHHFNNKKYIGGRCGTIFTSAFMFDSEENSIRVTRVWEPERPQALPEPHYSISELYNTSS